MKVCTKGKDKIPDDANFSSRVGGSLTRVLKGRGFAKEVEGKSFIAMKSAVMGTNQRFRCHF